MASESGLTGLLNLIRRLMRPGWMLSLFMLGALGCAKKESRQEATPKDERARSIYTVNYPLAYFAERLAPEGVEVLFPAPPDADPAFWKPTAAVIAQYQRAGLILLNGAGYARWTRYATLPTSRIVVTADTCRETYLQTGETMKHRHGPEGEHAHEGTAFTTWLDMRLARCQARRVRDALIELAPESQGVIEAKFQTLDGDLTELDARLSRAAKAWGDQPMLGSHPVYQYLADAYDLRIGSVHFEPDEAPSSEAIQELESLVARHPAKLMLWEAQPLLETEQLLRAQGIASVVFDPAARTPREGDFLTVMRANAERLACATGAEPCR